MYNPAAIHKVVFYDDKHVHDWPWLSIVFRKLGIEELLPAENDVLQQHFTLLVSDFVANILLCLNDPNDITSRLDDMKERVKFCRWLRSQLHVSSCLRNVSKAKVSSHKLLQLPIWEGQTTLGTGLFSAYSLEHSLLPATIGIESVLPFQKATTSVAAWGTNLEAFLKHCRNQTTISTMTASEILNVLELPLTFTDRQAIDYKNLINALIQKFPAKDMRWISFRIPDRTSDLRPIAELYDDSVSLFVSTLIFTPKSSFVHPRLRSLQSSLARFGLNSLLNQETFLHCISAVQAALDAYDGRDGASESISQGTIYSMAASAYKTFCDDLPAVLMLSYWATFNHIRFIRPLSSRRQGATFPADKYCDGRSIILSPSELVIQAYEPIAWTQRSLFMHQPSDQLLAVNSGLGVPTAEEVVRHDIIDYI